MDDVKTTVAKNINFYRKQKHLSQKALAEMIGVKHNTISSWENCTNSVDIDSLFRICKALDVSANDMFGMYSNEADHTLITAYRAHPEAQASVNKLLDIEAPPTDALAADLSRELNQVTHRMRNIPKEQLIKSKAP